jgi:hypothetical protein
VSVGDTRVAAPCMKKKIIALNGELNCAAESTRTSIDSSEMSSVRAERQ